MWISLRYGSRMARLHRASLMAMALVACTGDVASGDAGPRDGRVAPWPNDAFVPDSSVVDANTADATVFVDLSVADARALDAGPTDSGHSSVTPQVRTWVWNVAGHLIHRGATDTGMITAASRSIDNRDADFVAFNELCFQQYRALQEALRDLAWPVDTDNFSRFSETRPSGTSVCAGERFGNAIFSRLPLGSADDITLPSDGSVEHRSMLCAPLRDLPPLRFCTTHITTSNEVGADGFADNIRQLRDVQERLDAYHAAGDTVIIAGDFNARPHYRRLDRFYSPSVNGPNNGDNRGAHRELDDADPGNCPGHGERTTESSEADPCGRVGGTKIDHIFVRESDLVGPYEADSLSISNACGGPCSDHRILIGRSTVRVSVD